MAMLEAHRLHKRFGDRIVLDGRDITGLTPRAIARLGISRSFQLMNLFDDFSALENVALAVPERRRQGFRMLRDARQDSSVADKAAAVLARVGLAGKEHEIAKNLSYGDRRALEICVALAAEPRIMF